MYSTFFSVVFLRDALRQKPFTVASACLLELVGLAHLVRVIAGWEIVIGGVAVPMWVSGCAAAMLVGLAGLIWWELWNGRGARSEP